MEKKQTIENFTELLEEAGIPVEIVGTNFGYISKGISSTDFYKEINSLWKDE